MTLVGENRNSAFVKKTPLRWSRRWHDEPPVVTEVFLGYGLVEIHVGRGIWQTVTI